MNLHLSLVQSYIQSIGVCVSTGAPAPHLVLLPSPTESCGKRLPHLGMAMRPLEGPTWERMGYSLQLSRFCGSWSSHHGENPFWEKGYTIMNTTLVRKVHVYLKWENKLLNITKNTKLGKYHKHLEKQWDVFVGYPSDTAWGNLFRTQGPEGRYPALVIQLESGEAQNELRAQL